MKKRILSVCLILTMLLSMALPAFADATTDADAAKVQEGYQFKVTASDGTVTYGKFGTSYDGSGRDTSLLDADGKTVTLLTDVKMEKKELMLPGTYTIDGNGHTFNGGFRSETNNANVTFKNMTVVQKDEEALGGTAGLPYIYQINAGSKATFENCTFLPTGVPAFGHFIVRGELTMKSCKMLNVGLPTANKDDTKHVFFMDQPTSTLTLIDTTVTTVAENSKLAIITLTAAGTVNLKGNTVLTSPIGKEVDNKNGAATVNKDATVIIGQTVSGDGVWDGVSADTSWIDPANLKDSYEIDTAAKLAGLAKICTVQNKAAFPSTGEKMITFYITKDLDLGGHNWTPIGGTYATRFAGNIIGKKDGVEGAAVTISGLKVVGPAGKHNDGFIGTSDKNSKVANLIFLNPDVSTEANSCGTVIGYGRGGAVLENVQVLGGKLTASDKGSMIGGLVGYTKSGTVQMTNCLYVGDIVTGSEKTGGLVGYAQTGAAFTNCYVGGTVAANSANMIGGFVGQMDTVLTVENCQFDAFLKNSGEQTGALIGLYQPAKEGSTVKLTNVLISGLSFEATTAANGFALIGKIGGEGNVKTDMTNVVALAPMSLYAAKLDSVTMEGANVGFTKAATADVAMGGDAWTTREGKYPVLTVAKDASVNIYDIADYTWMDLTKDTLDIANLRQLIGFSAASKLYSFKGKTIRLTADIDGATLPEALKTVKTGGEMNSNIKTAFDGKFEKGTFSMTNLTFEGTGDMTFTVIWDPDNGSEPTRETYKYKETPTYKGETPTHASDDVYDYEFRGWDKEIVPVTEDVIYTAKWKKIKIQKETEPETKPDTAPDTTPDTTAPADSNDKGCQSSVVGVLFPLCIALAGVAISKKRREER